MQLEHSADICQIFYSERERTREILKTFQRVIANKNDQRVLQRILHLLFVYTKKKTNLLEILKNRIYIIWM